MKLIRATLTIGLTSALLFGTTPGDVNAQAQVGVHGNYSDIGTYQWGVGGRVGFFQPTGGGSTQAGIEAAYSYFFPDCAGLDCNSHGGHIALIAAQDVGGGAQPYVGLGTRYQKLELGTTNIDGDASDWGFLILFGTKMESDSPIAPFFEIGWSLFGDIANIWDFTLGARVKLGG